MVPQLLGIPVPCAGVQESVPFHTSFPVTVVRWGLMEPLCFEARADTEMTWVMLLLLSPAGSGQARYCLPPGFDMHLFESPGPLGSDAQQIIPTSQPIANNTGTL